MRPWGTKHLQHCQNWTEHIGLWHRNPKGGQPPRPIIVAFHRYQDREQALYWARQNEIQYKQHTLRFYPDLSASLSKKHAVFKNVKAAGYQKGIQFRLLYPARLRVTYGGKTLLFKTPSDAEAFHSWLVKGSADISATPEHED